MVFSVGLAGATGAVCGGAAGTVALVGVGADTVVPCVCCAVSCTFSVWSCTADMSYVIGATSYQFAFGDAIFAG